MKNFLLSNVSQIALTGKIEHSFDNPDGVMNAAKKEVILIEPAPLELLKLYWERRWKVRVAAGMSKIEAHAILFPNAQVGNA